MIDFRRFFSSYLDGRCRNSLNMTDWSNCLRLLDCDLLGCNDFHIAGLGIHDGSYLEWSGWLETIAEENSRFNCISISNELSGDRSWINELRFLLDDLFNNGGGFFRSNDFLIVVCSSLDLTKFILACDCLDLNWSDDFWAFNIIDNNFLCCKIFSYCYHFACIVLWFYNQTVCLDEVIWCNCSRNNCCCSQIELSMGWNGLGNLSVLVGLQGLNIDFSWLLWLRDNWDDLISNWCLSMGDKCNLAGFSISLKNNLANYAIVDC